MSFAPNYTPTVGFATEESNQTAGRSTVRTPAVDNELANISSSINAINSNLKKIQRDDNKLMDASVEPHTLSEQTRAILSVGNTNPRGNWTANTNYAFKDIVMFSNVAQICITPHNSGTVFTQSFWMPISGDGTSAANAAAAASSAASAAASASSATSSAASASSSASSASTSAGNAATSEVNSSNSASSAATSAASAADSAANAALNVDFPEVAFDQAADFLVFSDTSDSNKKKKVKSGLGILDRTGLAGQILTAQGAGVAPAWDADKYLGIGQAYGSNLAGVSRFFNTTYTNTGSKPRFVSVGVTFPAASSQVTLLVDGHQVGFAGSSSVVIAGQVCAIVPPGGTYQAVNTGAGATGTYWHELS
ncbi:hypothetical protein FNL37_1764 [Methylovorus glucosotrophus]|uniref:hypothetical protein n=1 Tax=Methylovorus glucosotrophus TaxID=266009 RepID=UPI0013313788|nr:hypothetical protein [Methylovorus glucosotrophus]KAF0844320.1 hypothetical protein FNL37_1764 [Methylovorus glucosotrophus]